MMWKFTLYFKNGASVEIEAEFMVTAEKANYYLFYGEDRELFAEFRKEDIAGWVQERKK